MRTFRYIKAPDIYVPRRGEASAFVGGGIPNVRPRAWREEQAVPMLRDGVDDLVTVDGIDGLAVVDPEQSDFPIGDPVAGLAQVTWEHEHLRKVTVGMFWFPESDPTVPQPSTLWELAQAVSERRSFAVGADPAYGRRDILEFQLAQYPHVVLHDTLPATVGATLQLLAEVGGDRG